MGLCSAMDSLSVDLPVISLMPSQKVIHYAVCTAPDGVTSPNDRKDGLELKFSGWTSVDFKQDIYV